MDGINRRSVVAGSLGIALSGTVSEPYIAPTAAKTATIWQVQAFFPEEDAAFRKSVADYEKASQRH
ncbi:MAG: hypothetical protein JO227_05575 [Acetobacteraceae bacterium]|nr:hypothetical protein [Acetobacteraceae bacterium]